MKNLTKSKKLCLILAVVLAVALVAEVAIVIFVPASSTVSFDPSSMQMPDGTMPQMDGGDIPDGTMPQMDSGDIPDGTMPQADSGEIPDGTMPQNMQMPTQAMGQSQGGILSTLRRVWLPIVLICAAGIGVCLFVLLRRRPEPQAEEAPAEGDEDDDIPAHRKKKKWWIIPVCLLLVVTVILAALPSSSATQGSSVTVNEEVLSGTAEAGTITTVLTGAGTISPKITQEITVPDVVEVETYHVQNGDQVYAGDVLATMKLTTVTTAIAELQDVLDDLDNDLENARSSSASSYILAPASGRVKAILAEKGDDIATVTAEQGAVLLLSLDGRMKVEISSDTLVAGDSLTVTLEDGTELTGRVDSCRDGTAVVTVSDETAPYGAAAQVYDESGTLLGEGTLEINSEMKVVGTYGTVANITTALNQKVSTGSTLFYLTDVGTSQTYQTLLARREELEEQMEALFELYPDGKLIAKEDGIVSGIPDDAEYEALSSDEEGTSADALAATSGSTWKIVLLSNTESGGESEGTPSNDSNDGNSGDGSDGGSDSGTGGESGGSTGGEGTPGTSEGETNTVRARAISYIYDENGKIIGLTLKTDTETISFYGTITDSEGNTLSYDAINVGGVSGDILVFTGSDYSSAVCDQSSSNTQTPGGMGDMSAMAGMSGMDASSMMGSSGSSSGTTTENSYDTYEIGTTTVLTLASQETMVIEIPVDELDVLSLETGVEAEITLDALKSQSFTGTVESIGRTGTNSGGNTKYTVEISLPGTDEMLSGMNASVAITTATTEAAITIPVAALQEQGGKTYVYTGYSEKDDTLTDLVEVEIGVSDADTVEILSGLSAGDTYYYRYASSITYTYVS